MLTNLHHIGFLRSSLASGEELISQGYSQVVGPIHESKFFVTNLLLEKQGFPRVELVVPDDVSAANRKFLDTSYSHHLCFEVNDIYTVLQVTTNQGGRMVSGISHSQLHNSEICFVHIKHLGLVELLQAR